MNDAAGETVDAHVKAVDADHTQLPAQEKQMESEFSALAENDLAHLQPSRWWFVSSAFPMMAGTLGPVASAFSICALVRPWRQEYVPTAGLGAGDSRDVKDPAWLVAVNAVQLLIAVLANVALLLNMTRRLRFSVAQPITILGWYVSAICLVSLTATAAGRLVIASTDQIKYIWSQAFYYGIYAAVLYFLCSTLMLVTYLGAKFGRYYAEDFMLTDSQRTLMLQTIMFLVYLLGGALVFSKIEGWTFLDTIYFTDVTLFTIGFGDIYATTTLGRALFMPYSLVGIISLGLVIGSIRALVLDRGKTRLDARIVEKRRREMIRRMKRKGEDGVLAPIESKDRCSSRYRSRTGMTEFERRKLEFELMRTIQDEAGRRRRWVALAVSLGTWLVLWLVGARVFQQCEKEDQDWTYFEGVYFCYVSFTTIGYGDVTPKSNAGRSFFVFWSLLALPTMTVLISNAGDTVVKLIRDGTDMLGTVTILPGEANFRTRSRALMRQLSCGRMFRDDRSMYRRSSGTRTGIEDPAGPPQESLPPIPSRAAEYHVTLMREIRRVMEHMKNEPRRKYGFEEWAYYLRLVGEDEARAETHRKAEPHRHGRTKAISNAADKAHVWSWVGSRSPLMTSLEEAGWILAKLTARLEHELLQREAGPKDEDMGKDGTGMR